MLEGTSTGCETWIVRLIHGTFYVIELGPTRLLPVIQELFGARANIEIPLRDLPLGP